MERTIGGETLDTRARLAGCLVGALVGDALGSQVEFASPAALVWRYPGGLRTIGPSAVWGTSAGQPTDDGELTLALCRALLAGGRFYAPDLALRAYLAWLESGPFDIGITIGRALRTFDPDRSSQANGALMRQAPLPVWAVAVGAGPDELARAVRQDTALTHPHPVCQAASVAHALGLRALLAGDPPAAAHRVALAWAQSVRPVARALAAAAPALGAAPDGWVLVALQRAWHAVLQARDVESGLVSVVMQGGDTDTNACIAGALLGARFGLDGIPARWRATVLGCRPGPGTPRPRPAWCWPAQALAVVDLLLGTPVAAGGEDGR
jgi:ADP-ribosylglycohydrolase